ncbi:MAG TPA: amidohydrolase [Pseudolabrys sp.]|nr:amidohydrolase [Pseudolabrys sp.]
MSEVTVFQAKKIITMDDGRPTASAVAVKDGRILSVGTIETMKPWLDRYPHHIDRTFADKIIMPGLIDPHTHLRWSGALTGLHYIGPIDSPNGVSKALRNRTEVIAHLKTLHAGMKDPHQPLFAWGHDPMLQGGHLHRDELDDISKERPLWVLSYAIHFLYVNSAMLGRLGAHEGMNLHGLGRYPDGRLNGQFVEMEATNFALEPFRQEVMSPENARRGLRMLANQAKKAGVTLTADLGFGVTDFETEWRDHEEIVLEHAFPLRMVLVPAEYPARKARGEDAVGFLSNLKKRNRDKLRFHGVKFWSDGSYQANSLRLNFPGYLDGTNGMRGDLPWEELADKMLPYWQRGVQIHAHANGDEALDAVLDALAELQRRLPRFDHRFTIEHYCISTPAQARRLRAYGGVASVNNYLVHYRTQVQNVNGLGPDRAETTARLGTLEREGVIFTLHSDYALVVVPLHPLTAAWIAMTRIAADGKTVQAPGERIGRERALRAITIDAAYVLRMDAEVGSIEVGKFADFAILDQDPTIVDIDRFKDIHIWGTVLGGVKQPA